MGRIPRWAVGAVMVLVAGLGAPALAPASESAGGQAAQPSVTVTPSTDLVDGQPITVTGTGFLAESAIRITFCPTGATTPGDCHPVQDDAYAPGGTFTTEVPARALLRIGDTEHDCRQPEACVMGVNHWDGADADTIWTPLHFVPDGPLAPPPAITVSPTEGLVDGQPLTVTGTGFIRQPWGQLYQCVADADIDWSSCDVEASGDFAVTDGTFEATFLSSALLFTDDHGTVDCREPERCLLVATSDFDDPAMTATAALAFDPAGALPDPPTLTVTPAADLVDGQTVRVEGQRFRATGSLVQIHRCAPDPDPAGERCQADEDRYLEIGDDGTFTTEVPVTARISTPDGMVDCRTSPDPCLLIATTWTIDSPRAARTELHFDPDAPLLPEPEISVTPTENLRDFTNLEVTGRHFTPGGQVTVRLCHAEDPDRCDDENAEEPTPAADGTLTNELGGWATFVGWGEGGPVDCRQPPGCALVATDETRDLSASVPLAFGPADGPRGRYLDPVVDDVEVEHDVLYRETLDHRGNPVQLKMDIYRPAGDTATSRPAVVWMHGGWYIFGDKADMAPLATEVARRGYVGVSLQYRLRPDMSTTDLESLYYATLDAYDDATAGVEWLQAHAGEYGIDPDAIAAGGYSAGAGTSFNLAYMPGQRGPATSLIAAALPISGLNIAQPDPGEPPSIIFHSTADTVLPANNGDTVCPLAQPLGITCELVAWDGADHELRERDVVQRGTDFIVEQVLEPAGYFDVMADAGGAYEVDEGSRVTLAGSGAAGGDAGPTYAWTPAERVDDPASPTASVTGHDDGTEVLTLTATSSHGITATDTANVTTTNVDPTIDDPILTPAAAGRRPGSSPAPLPPPSAARLDATVTDPGVADTHEATVDWGDGTTAPATVEQAAGRATVHGTHDYAEPGRYEVTLTVTDDDGGTDTWTDEVVVGCTVTG